MKKILVIDDEYNLRAFFKQLLKDEYKVTTVSSIKEAVEYLNNEEDEIDLIFLDVYIGYDYGIDALKKIKRFFNETPIIVMSVFDISANASKAIQNGAAEFITKDFSPEMIIELVEKYTTEVEVLGARALPNPTNDFVNLRLIDTK